MPQGYYIPRVSQNVLQATNGTPYQQARGVNLPLVAYYLRSLQNAGLLMQDPGNTMFPGVEFTAPDYEFGLRLGGFTPLDSAIPLSSLHDDVRVKLPDII